MKVKFKGGAIWDGKRYFKNSTHVLDDALYDHWFFQRMLNAGFVELLESPAAAETKKSTTKKAT